MIDMNKIVTSIINSPENIKKDKQLHLKLKQDIKRFNAEHLEPKYYAATLKAYKIEQQMSK